MERAHARVRLVLIGAGHAHLEVIRRLIRLTPASSWAELSLVSSAAKHYYSGMVPGYLRGTYREEEIAFELAPLVSAVGGELLVKRAVGIDAGRRLVHLEGGKSITYDLASFNVGSGTVGGETASPQAALIKPMSRAIELRRRILELAHRDAETKRHAAVVGGGAAGVEVACAIAAVLEEAGCRSEITLVEASDRILSSYSRRFSRLAERALQRTGIAIRTGLRAVKVHSDAVELEDGSGVPAELTVWLTGPQAPEIFRSSGLDVDRGGFLLVDDSLRSLSDPTIFGVGDCVTLVNYPKTPKAGVYAVRQGPILWKSLLCAVGRAPLPRYRPQEGFLSLLNTADGRALLRYKDYVSHGRCAWWLKDWIDRRFVGRYQRLVRA